MLLSVLNPKLITKIKVNPEKLIKIIMFDRWIQYVFENCLKRYWFEMIFIKIDSCKSSS